MGKATYQDVLDAPEHMVAELIDGELHLFPRPAQPHAIAGSVIGMVIGSAFHLGSTGPGGWWIEDEPELHLGPHVLVPDVAGWIRAEVDLDLSAAYVETPPAWICEVLSPSTHRVDRMKKLPRYAEFGVRFAWLVDPVDGTLEVFALERDRWVLQATHEGADPVRVAPFAEVELPLAEVWPLAARRGEAERRG